MTRTKPFAIAGERRERAVDFLKRLLANGPVAAGEVRAATMVSRHGWRTVQTASEKLNVKRRKDSMRGGWVWELLTHDPEGAGSIGAFGNEGSDRSPGRPMGCLAAYGFEVPFDGLMHGVPHRD